MPELLFHIFLLSARGGASYADFPSLLDRNPMAVLRCIKEDLCCASQNDALDNVSASGWAAGRCDAGQKSKMGLLLRSGDNSLASSPFDPEADRR